MNRGSKRKDRKELEDKLAKVFEKEMKTLPTEFKKIMANDLVSAFESRLCALSRAQSNLNFVMIEERELHIETV